MPLTRRLVSRFRNFLPPKDYTYAGNDWGKAEAKHHPKGWNAESVLTQYRSSWTETVEYVAEANALPIKVTHDVFKNVSLKYPSKIRVLDYGAGLGWYLALFQKVRPDLQIDYVGYDLPLLAGEGGRLWPEAEFVSSLDKVEGQFDFVLLSGALQYIPDWRFELNLIASKCRDTLFLTRCPVTNGHTHLLVQSAYGSEWITWVWNKDELLNTFKNTGLDYIEEIDLGLAPTRPWRAPSHRQTAFVFTR